MIETINITNPGATPANGDILQYTYENGAAVKKQFNVFNTEVTSHSARLWRNQELERSDWIVPVSDHPQHAAHMTYRTALRDWPSTSNFPATKPVLGE
jgi:hypothetical protein